MNKSTADSITAVNERFRGLIRGLSSRTAGFIGVLLLSGLIGSYLLTSSHAATTAKSVEPESGSVNSQAAPVTDATASGSKAVKFGAGTTTTSTATMCVSKGDDVHDGYPNWDAVRVYNFSTVAKPIAAGARVIALTDPAISYTGGQSAADALDTKLASFFQTYPNIEVHWGLDNEVDRDITSANGAAYVNTVHLMRPVIDKYKNQGRKISLWTDLTANNINTDPNNVEEIIQQTAPDLDGVAVSMYPPGTSITDFPGFIDPIFALVKKWGIGQVSMWEGGSKITDLSTSQTSITLTDANGAKKTYNVSSYKQIRPLWTAYYAKYIVDSGVKDNIKVNLLCWWDGDTSGRETEFLHDPAGTSPLTVETWRNWQSWIGQSQ